MKFMILALLFISCKRELSISEARTQTKQKTQQSKLFDLFGEMVCVDTNANTFACENKLLYCIKIDSHRKGGIWCEKKENIKN